MGWIKQSKPPCRHLDRPTLPARRFPENSYMLGDVWECDNCTTQFEVIADTGTDLCFINCEDIELIEIKVFSWRKLPGCEEIRS